MKMKQMFSLKANKLEKYLKLSKVFFWNTESVSISFLNLRTLSVSAFAIVLVIC